MKNILKKKTTNEGCGVRGGIEPPYAVFFRASCEKHDRGYIKGGDELDRWYCDVRFLNAMRYDVKRYYRRRFFPRLYFLAWCYLYFWAVRLFGRQHFNTIKNKNKND